MNATTADLGQDGLPPPLDEESPPPLNRFCDLVMKGGVVDGVLYPWAILELARHYRFKNLGGTSVGAMAAALAAAAEYGRRYGSNAGFNVVLRELPKNLASVVPNSGAQGGEGAGPTRLLSLFHPAPGTRRLFQLFVCLLGSGRSAWGKVAAIASMFLPTLLRALGLVVCIRLCHADGISMWLGLLSLSGMTYLLAKAWHPVAKGRWAFGLSCAAVLCLSALTAVAWVKLPGWHVAWALVPLALLWAGLSLCELWREVVLGVVPNHFGLCTGATLKGKEHTGPGLVEWLHEGIQGASGRPLNSPLTFKDLWDAPGGPDTSQSGRKERSIDLHVVSTNLTHARPYAFPLAAGENRLFFKPNEMADFFPKVVVDHLIKSSQEYQARNVLEDPCANQVPEGLRELPVGELPILVAVRLSLSFPVLFSSVPLWAIDYTAPQGQRTVKPCRFSDGGLCSNFPIHVFDAALPRWPTFGITLDRDSRRGKQRPVWMPRFHNQGRGDAWQRIDESPAVPGKIAGFASSILASMREWNDTTSARLPGVRDRVVHVNLESLKNEATGGTSAGKSLGALDLEIKGDSILQMARELGLPAGRMLAVTFLPKGAPHPDGSQADVGRDAWHEHRWVRFQSFAGALRDRLEGFRRARQGNPQSLDLFAQIDAALAQPPLYSTDGRENHLTPAQAQALRDVVSALEQLEESNAASEIKQAYRPVPRAEMHLRSPL